MTYNGPPYYPPEYDKSDLLKAEPCQCDTVDWDEIIEDRDCCTDKSEHCHCGYCGGLLKIGE